jgi:hypothetical protein
LIAPITGDGVATICAALLGASVVVAGYFVQRSIARQADLGELYASAVSALDDYLEAPYRVRRRDGSAATRTAITNHISEIQSRLAHSDALLMQRAPLAVGRAFRAAVGAARVEAGRHMRDAWVRSPTRRDRDVSMTSGLSMPQSQAARQKLIDEMAPGARLLRKAIPPLTAIGVLGPLATVVAEGAYRVPDAVGAAFLLVFAIVEIAVAPSYTVPPLRLGRRVVASRIILVAAVSYLAICAIQVIGRLT